jgi:hypothetical protein
MKFLDDKDEPAMELLHDLIYSQDCTDARRLTDVLMQVRSHHRTRPSSDGLGLAMRRAGRGFSAEGQLNDVWKGLPQTRLVEQLSAASRDVLIEKLRAIGAFLSASGRPTASFTGADRAAAKVHDLLNGWASRHPARAGSGGWTFQRDVATELAGLAAPMNVAYCAMVFPAPRILDPLAPILAVGSRIVSYDHVLEEVRFKGTAYGGGCAYGSGVGVWEFYSYRDPWIWKTLDAYRAAEKFVRDSDWLQADVDRAIIGTAKEFERPNRPAESTGTALWRHLSGDTFARRQARHAAMLEATPDKVKKALLAVFEAGFPAASVCVVSSRQKLEEANRERPGSVLEIEDILGEEK